MKTYRNGVISSAEEVLHGVQFNCLKQLISALSKLVSKY